MLPEHLSQFAVNCTLCEVAQSANLRFRERGALIDDSTFGEPIELWPPSPPAVQPSDPPEEDQTTRAPADDNAKEAEAQTTKAPTNGNAKAKYDETKNNPAAPRKHGNDQLVFFPLDTSSGSPP